MQLLEFDIVLLHLFLGGAGGLAPSPAWTSVGDNQSGAIFAFAVAGAGDVNADGETRP